MTANKRARDVLDRYWDGLTVRPERIDDPGLDEIPEWCSAAVIQFHARDDAPNPDPAFLRRLREDLMDQALNGTSASRTAAPRRTGRSCRVAAHYHGTIPLQDTGRPRLLRRFGRAWAPAFELAAVCILLLSIAGLAGGDNLLTALIPSRQDVQDGDAGIFLGNSARNGQQPGSGPAGYPGLLWQLTFEEDDNLSLTGPPIVAAGTVYLSAERRTGATSGVGPVILAVSADDGTERWRRVLNGETVFAPIATANGLVIVGSYSQLQLPDEPGAVIALDADTGEEVWRHIGGDRAFASAAIVDGTIYIGSTDGSVDALDLTTGSSRWHADAVDLRTDGGGEIVFPSSGTVAVADGLVFVPIAAPIGEPGSLAALDIDDGSLVWQAEVQFNVPGTPVVSGDAVYVVASQVSEDERDQGRLLIAIELATGQQRWTSLSGTTLAAKDDVVYVAGAGVERDLLVALDATSGEERWTVGFGDSLAQPPALAGDNLYVAASDSSISAIDAETGGIRWTIYGSPGNSSAPTVVGDRLFWWSGADLYGFGESSEGPGTPAATPITGGDVSGLPSCTAVPRPVDADPPLVGTPANEIVAESLVERTGQTSAMKVADVPSGDPASAEQLAGIRSTLDAMVGCNRPGRERQLASFYSDDYFRRDSVEFRFAFMAEGYRGLYPPLSAVDLAEAETRQLSDGRIGVLLMRQNDYGVFVVFANVDDRWLIDEIVEITEMPESRG